MESLIGTWKSHKRDNPSHITGPVVWLVLCGLFGLIPFTVVYSSRGYPDNRFQWLLFFVPCLAIGIIPVLCFLTLERKLTIEKSGNTWTCHMSDKFNLTAELDKPVITTESDGEGNAINYTWTMSWANNELLVVGKGRWILRINDNDQLELEDRIEDCCYCFSSTEVFRRIQNA